MDARQNTEETNAKERRALLELICNARRRRYAHGDEYNELLHRYGGALIGKKKWKTNCLTHRFSDYTTVADEAFLWLCLDTHLPVYNPSNIGNANSVQKKQMMVSVKKNKQANDLENKENVTTANGNRFGWTHDAINKYNKYFKSIAEEREAMSETFDEAFVRYCNDKASNKDSASTTVRKEIVTACHCL